MKKMKHNDYQMTECIFTTIYALLLLLLLYYYYAITITDESAPNSKTV